MKKYTVLMDESKREITINGKRYELVPIPAKPKPMTLSDKVSICGYTTYSEKDIKKFIYKMHNKMQTLICNSDDKEDQKAVLRFETSCGK